MNLFGASGHAKVIIDILKINHQSIDTIWDDNPQIDSFENYKVSGKIADAKLEEGSQSIISIGNNKIRKQLAFSIKSDFGSAIHPSSNIASSVSIGEGSVVMAGVSINAQSKIGKHAIINTNSSIDHDCVLSDFVHISPNVALAGNVTVGEGSHIGIGACVIQGINIGKWATIGAGTVIIKDIPDYATVVGNPGKIIKISTDHD